MQKQHLNTALQNLEFQESLLLEAQEISDIGSFYIDFINRENSVFTPQTHQISGLTHGDEATFINLIHPDDAPTVRNLWEEALERGGPFAYSFRFQNGDIEKKLNARGIVVRDNGRVTIVKGTLRDITAFDRLIKRLTDSEMLHKRAQQLTHLGNWSWNIGDETVYWSDELYRIYGLEPQSEVITFERFLSLIHPDDRDRRVKEIEDSIRTGLAKDYVLKIITPTGEIKILKGHGSVEFDADRNPITLVGTCQDITREYHLNNELVALNRSLHQKNLELVQINKELESFNYIASHDLQEPLRKIRMFAGRINDQSESLSERAQQSLERVIDSASRMQQLIADLIEFSQISGGEKQTEKISLNDLVDEVLENYAENIESGQVKFNISTLPEVEVVPFQFLQLLSNLIGNAVKYKKEHTTAEISISSTTVTPLDDVAVSQGEYMRISICDNGIGFEPEQRENIFELFKRLHPHSKFSGTGIGLAICKKIIHHHNGFIKADSILGEGSCFHIYLPATSA
ncbi:MAG: PAS domain-containing protein [Flavobacterium sp.]|nr:PAS domain-containing protein [Flavobacterium sp.]